jgi:hypothetical protein
MALGERPHCLWGRRGRAAEARIPVLEADAVDAAALAGFELLGQFHSISRPCGRVATRDSLTILVDIGAPTAQQR